MLVIIVLMLSTPIMDCIAKPTTESTHMILQRLGFDEVHRPAVNHHRKRVAQELTKARHHIDGYNTETDSHMFVVKLPPHSPYYSHLTPEKFEKNEVVPKSSMNFRTNGKPAGVYHWNIPVLKRLPQARYNPSRQQGDSKVYHVKILPNSDKDKPYKKYNKFKKQRYEDRVDRTRVGNYHKNNVRLYNVKLTSKRREQEHPKLIENEYPKLKLGNYLPKTKNKHQKMSNESVLRDAANAKDKRQAGPTYYQPALPKQNSFHKDFTGNGRPKSFYVIDKSNKASRYHRLF